MLLFSSIDLESVFDWLCDLRLDYSHNNDIWDLRRHWESLKHTFLHQMNTGTYQFNALDVYVHGDVSIYLWSSLDMIALKLITQALSSKISVPSSCYHTKGKVMHPWNRTENDKNLRESFSKIEYSLFSFFCKVKKTIFI